MSATATATASDRSDFRTVMVGGTQVGVLTAVAVVVFLFVSRQVTAVVPQRVLETLVVLATGLAVSFLPARLTQARQVEGIAGAAVPRWFAHLLIVLGWLVTPLLAWGASYAGLWVGALVGTRFTAPLTMLAVAGIGAALFGFAALALWVRFMRRAPHLLSHHMAPRPSQEQAAVAAAD